MWLTGGGGVVGRWAVHTVEGFLDVGTGTLMRGDVA